MASFSLDEPLALFLGRVASAEPVPGAGAVAAVACAMAAGLVAMAARFSREWPDAEEALGRAEQLRAAAAPLARLDAEAYGEVLASRRLPPESESRDAKLAAALSHAADVPLAIAEAAAEVAALAALAAERGSEQLRGEAAMAALLAEAAARGTAELVAINLRGQGEDERVGRARKLAAAATDASRRALDAAG